MTSSNNILNDVLSLYWNATKRVGPKDRNDIFYTSFAVSLLTLTQLAFVIFVAGSLGASLVDRLSSGFVTSLILALAGVLAALNSLVIFSVDKKKSRPKIGAKRRFAAFTVMIVYFALAIACAFKIFAWR